MYKCEDEYDYMPTHANPQQNAMRGRCLSTGVNSDKITLPICFAA